MSVVINNSTKLLDTVLFKLVAVDAIKHVFKNQPKLSYNIRDISYQIKNIYLTLDPNYQTISLFLQTYEPTSDIIIQAIPKNTAKVIPFGKKNEPSKLEPHSTYSTRLHISDYTDCNYIDLIILFQSGNSRNIKLINTTKNVVTPLNYKVILCYFSVLPIVVDYSVPIDNNVKMIYPDFNRQILLYPPLITDKDLRAESYICFDPFTSCYRPDYYLGILQDLNKALNYRFLNNTTNKALLYSLNTLQKLLSNADRISFTLHFKSIVSSEKDIDIIINSGQHNVKDNVICTILGTKSIKYMIDNIQTTLTLLESKSLQSHFIEYTLIDSNLLNINSYMFTYDNVLNWPELNTLYSCIVHTRNDLSPANLLTLFIELLIEHELITNFVYLVSLKYNILYYTLVNPVDNHKAVTEYTEIHSLFVETFNLKDSKLYKLLVAQYITPLDPIYKFYSIWLSDYIINNTVVSVAEEDYEDVFFNEEDAEEGSDLMQDEGEDEGEDEGSELYKVQRESNGGDDQWLDMAAKEFTKNKPYVPLDSIPIVDNFNSNISTIGINLLLATKKVDTNELTLKLFNYPVEHSKVDVNTLLTGDHDKLFYDITYIQDLSRLPIHKIKLLLLKISVIEYVHTKILTNKDSLTNTSEVVKYVDSTIQINKVDTPESTVDLIYYNLSNLPIVLRLRATSYLSTSVMLNKRHVKLTAMLYAKELHVLEGIQEIMISPIENRDPMWRQDPIHYVTRDYINSMHAYVKFQKKALTAKYTGMVNNLDLLKVSINLLALSNQIDPKTLLELYNEILEKTALMHRLPLLDDAYKRPKKDETTLLIPTNILIHSITQKSTKIKGKDTDSEIVSKLEFNRTTTNINVIFKNIKEYKYSLKEYYNNILGIQDKFNEYINNNKSLGIRVNNNNNNNNSVVDKEFQKLIKNILDKYNVQLPTSSAITSSAICSLFVYLILSINIANTDFINLKTLFDTLSIIRYRGALYIYMELIVFKGLVPARIVALDINTGVFVLNKENPISSMYAITDIALDTVIIIKKSNIYITNATIVTDNVSARWIQYTKKNNIFTPANAKFIYNINLSEVKGEECILVFVNISKDIVYKVLLTNNL